MTMIEYDEKNYRVLETQEIDEGLHYKLVKFDTGFYGIISYNPISKKERVTVVSPDKDSILKNKMEWIGGLGCGAFMIFAREVKRYLENSPVELIVQLGHEAPEEYREIITNTQGKTLYEKVEICYEIMQMKHENSFHYKYGDSILTVLICMSILFLIIAIVNTLRLYGGL